MKNIYLLVIIALMTLAACAAPNTDNGNTGNENENNNEKAESENVESNNQEIEEVQNEENQTNETNEEEASEAETDPPAEYEVSQETWSIEPLNDEANEKVVLLTIDDAPDEHALEMAHTLKDLEANAIFFVNGHFLETEEEKETLKEIHDMGFLIGNHTYSHPYLPDLAPEEQREEIIEVSDMVEDIIGERPAFFRAPNGANTDTSREVVDEENMVFMNWSYGYDFKKDYMSQEAITDIMLNTELLQSGSNLLMHDRDWTNAALEDIVTGLRDKGYEMVDPNLIETKKE